MNLQLQLQPKTWHVQLPPSKSIVNRQLMLEALAGQADDMLWADDPLVCDDIRVMARGLRAASGDTIDVDGAGIALRLLTAHWAARPGCAVTITGNRRLCERPIAPQVEALRQLGADIRYAAHEGHAPLHIVGRQLTGQTLRLRGDVSSQFVSALLMIAPVVGGLQLELMGDIVSRPYIDMTIALMERHGVQAQWLGNTIRVPAGTYLPAPLTDEADWSSAAFWLALQALLPQSHIRLYGLRRDSLQGDRRIMHIMQQMGMTLHWHDDGSLTADMSRAGCCCCSTYADLCDTPDLAPVLVVLLCLLGRPLRITGLRTLRHKESDRLEALRTELRKLGYDITIEGDDAVSWHFATCAAQPAPVLDPHGDHRLAMALSLAATRHRRLTLTHAEVISKSYPTLWQQLKPNL